MNDLLSAIREPGEKEITEEVIKILTDRGFKIQRPPRQIKDEYTFDNVWNLYQKKVGSKEKLEKKWNSMSLKDRKAAMESIPSYVLSTPDKKYRLNFQTYLNQRRWEDELIGATPPPAVSNEKPSEISLLIAKTKQTLLESTQENKDKALLQKIYGMIELLKENPRSLCRKQLEIYRDNGTIARLGINWQ